MRRIAAAVLLMLVTASCGDNDAAGAIDTPEYLRFRSQETACGAVAPAAARDLRFAAPADMGVEGRAVATLHTSCGDIVVELLADKAPATVDSFVFLARRGYFDGTVSHRIAPGFVVQMGDPTATGRGGPGYEIPDELPKGGNSYRKGVVAMANAGPGTGGSQFFIALADVSLDPDYTVFGRVTAGFDVLEAIAAIPVGVNPATLEASLPLRTLYLESVEVEW